MNTYLFFANHMLFTGIIVFIYGAVIGSFLNVVIYRYPIMLIREWNHDCSIQLKIPLPPKEETFNLHTPRSHCVHCKKPIPFWLNIPIFSYIFLRGKCYFCKTHFSSQYLWVELLTAVLSVMIVFRYGLTLQAFSLMIFTYFLIALSFIDYRHQFLPDTLTLSLMWIGLLISTRHLFVLPTQAIFGAVIGYLFLWIIAKLYLVFRKKEGMGYGDCKMLAMVGAWVGAGSLLNVLVISSVLALIVAVILILAKKMDRQHPIPFGPFIGIAGWITMINGNQLVLWLTSFTR